jgi:hypothetical protein
LIAARAAVCEVSTIETAELFRGAVLKEEKAPMAKFFEVAVKEGADMQTWQVNADAVRYIRPIQATKATLVFDREHRLDVQDCIADLQARVVALR